MAPLDGPDFKHTLNLPKTDFPMKANLPQREPEMLALWEKEGLYGKIQEARGVRKSFTLHDGPPYANGHIHMGHALNKVLKDIVVKSKWLAGYHSHYVPGWDCHGLPIEHKVDEELKFRRKALPALTVRQACRRYAAKYIDIQRGEFVRLGVFGDWEHPYITMDYGYEARIAREFGRFVETGAVYRRKKPVHWCPSCVTALAEAEVEYADVASPSIFVRFAFTENLGARVPELAGKKVSAVIWTTTPWTIPANMAVALHPDFEYTAVRHGDELLVLASDRAEKALEEMDLGRMEIYARFPGRALEGAKTRHPLYDRPSPVVLATYVTLDAGTGCVHTAPGHGQEDYETGVKYGLPVFSPVDDEGRFTDEAPPFSGKRVRNANPEVVEALRASGALLADGQVRHSYPHCWRCKKPVLFRATEQWFIAMDKGDLRGKALAAIMNDVTWVPPWGRDRIHGMIESRPDWCISRQRVWGSPITVFHCEGCGEILMSRELCDHVAGIFEREGADAWYAREAAELLPPGTKCVKCGGTAFRKDGNILDVWFDSGVSHAAVLEDPGNHLPWPADMYLEGSDQHRGWFHSSLLAAVGTRGKPPYREVLTHGHVVDAQGNKMSKSLGNVISPLDLMKNHGADVVRLWVAGADYTDDIRVSDEILARTADSYRKIRNTLRYLLGNLYDFDPARDAVDLKDMEELDRWALERMAQVVSRVRGAYREYAFHLVARELHEFCAVDLSSFYLDVLKDRLYASAAAGSGRRSAQTALFRIADGIVRLMAPVLSFTSEEAWRHLPGKRPESVFLAEFPDETTPGDLALTNRYQRLLTVREVVTRALEAVRQAKMIGTSLEAKVGVFVRNPEDAGLLASFGPGLADLFIVSQVRVEPIKGDVGDTNAFTVFDTGPGIGVVVEKAEGSKCPRCWKYDTKAAADTPCPRCRAALGGK
jgi:isoleucyl-tRNA synthetase